MRIYKGSNQEITVAVAPCCYVGDMENLVLNFYTTEGMAIEFSGDSITLSGKNATVVFQPAQLDLLEDGVIKYISTFEDEGEEKTYDMTSQYYLKTPASYVSQHFITEENLIETIENNEQINNYIDEKFTGYTPTEQLNDELSALYDYADTKIPKPTSASGRGSQIQPVYITVAGNTSVCRVSTAATTRWNSLVASDSAGFTHAGRAIVLHQSGQESGTIPYIGKFPAFGGFTVLYTTTGDETNTITNENQHYLVDSRDYMHIKLISYDDYDQLVEDNEVDPKTIYLFSGDTFGTERKIHKYIQNDAVDGFEYVEAVDGTLVYKHDEGEEYGYFLFMDDQGRMHYLVDTSDLEARMVEVENDLLDKQDELIPGSGISIEGNVISCSISGDTVITSGQVQTMISEAMATETARTEATYATMEEVEAKNYIDRTEMDNNFSFHRQWTIDNFEGKNEFNAAMAAETARTETTYAKIRDLSNYSTTADTADAISSALTDYSTTADTADAISSALTGYATEQWVKSQGYITGYTGSTSINDAGNNYTPIYISGGTAIASRISAPGNRWGVPLIVAPDGGGVEGGAFLDFHNTSGNTSDYSGRVQKKAATAGFSFMYSVAGTETNTLASNEHYAVDSRDIIHIQKITQSAYDALAVKDNLTLYIIV